MKQRSRVFVLLLIVLVAGCAARARQAALEDWKAKLDPLVGKGQGDVLLMFGPPTDKAVADSVEVWRYYQSKGTRSWNTENLWTGQKLGETTWSKYDDIKLFFINGIVTRWSADIIR